ncbi:hypothetical protein N9142_02335 [Akkermansiaceae bacterium]|nr:hypothetical protein [bacterium]MDB4433955.1 hypothetical protein [Akkermansiaceae bacterium]
MALFRFLRKWWYITSAKYKWFIACLLLLVINLGMIFGLGIVSRGLWVLNFIALGLAMVLPSDYDD